MESWEEKFSESSDSSNNASQFQAKLHEDLSNLLADPSVRDFIPKFKNHITKLISETKVENYDSLIEILPTLLKYALQLYSYNGLMDNANDSKDYFDFVTMLLLEFLKGKFLKREIIGNVAEQMIIDLILTYLYRNEGAIMDLLLQLTFWVENSLDKSHIHLENLFKLTSNLYLTLIVHNCVYREAQYTNLSLLNYIRALFLFKVLKHLETECNAAKASLEVQIEDRINSKIEQMVLNVLPIHPQLELVLGLLDRVFPESKLSLLRTKMRGFLVTYDYYLFERIAGLLDFELQHAPYIDLKGNINLKLMQQKRVRYNNCCKILSKFTDPVLRKFVPEKCLTTKDFRKQHNWSYKFTKHVPVVHENRTHESKNRTSFNREEQLFITSNDNVPVLCVHRDLENGKKAYLQRFVDDALKDSTRTDVSRNRPKRRFSPPHEELIDKQNPNCCIKNCSTQLPIVASRPEVENLHRREIVGELQDSNLNKSSSIFGKSFTSSLASIPLKPETMLFCTLTNNTVIPKVEETEVSRLLDKMEKIKLDTKKVILIKPSKINFEKSSRLRRINPPNPWSNSKWVDHRERCSKKNTPECTNSTSHSNISSDANVIYGIRPRSSRELFNEDSALPYDKKLKEPNSQTNSQQTTSIFPKSEHFSKLRNKPTNLITEMSRKSGSNLNPTARFSTKLPLESIVVNTGTTSSLNGLTLETSFKQSINVNVPENNLHNVHQEQEKHHSRLLTLDDKKLTDNMEEVVVESAQETSNLNVDLHSDAGNSPCSLDHDYANKQISPHEQLQTTNSPNNVSQISCTKSQVCNLIMSNNHKNEKVLSKNQVGKINTTSISNNKEHEESSSTSEGKNQLIQVAKECLESSCKSYESHANLMSTMLNTSSVSSMENIINEIVQVAENMEKTDSRSSELTPYCTSTLLTSNKYAAIEPDEMVAHFSEGTIGNEKLNHKNCNNSLQIKENIEKGSSSQKETGTSKSASCDSVPSLLQLEVLSETDQSDLESEAINNIEQINKHRSVPVVTTNEKELINSKAHASEHDQPTNFEDVKTSGSLLYPCTSESEIINYEKIAQEDFREESEETSYSNVTQQSNQNKNSKELERPVQIETIHEKVLLSSKEHASENDQPTNFTDATTSGSLLYLCTSESEMKNYEKIVQEDFREELEETSFNTITEQSHQNKDLKELDRPVSIEINSKAHESENDQPTNFADATASRTLFYPCTSESDMNNYEKNALGDFREEFEEISSNSITEQYLQNKDLKEKNSHDQRSEVSSDEETIDPCLFEELTEAPFIQQHSLGMKLDQETSSTNSEYRQVEQKSAKKMEPRKVSIEYENENAKKKYPQPDKLFDMEIVKQKDLKTYTVNKNKLRKKSKKNLQKKSFNTSKIINKNPQKISNTTHMNVPKDHSIPLSPQAKEHKSCFSKNLTENFPNDTCVESNCENSNVNCETVEEDLVLNYSRIKDQAKETESINNLVDSMTYEENHDSNRKISSTESIIQNEICKQKDKFLQQSDLVSKDIEKQEILNKCTAENNHGFSSLDDPNKSLCFNLSGKSQCFDVDKEKEQNGKEISNNPDSLSNSSEVILKNCEISDMSVDESNKLEYKGSQVDKVQNNNDDPNISAIFELSNASSVKNIFEKTPNLRGKASRKFLDEFSNEVKNNVRRNKRKSSCGNFISKADISQKLRRISAITSEKLSLSPLLKNNNEKGMTLREVPLVSSQVVFNTEVTQSQSKSSLSAAPLEIFDNYLNFKLRRSSSNLASLPEKISKKHVKDVNTKSHLVDTNNCSSVMNSHKREIRNSDTKTSPPQKSTLDNVIEKNPELEHLKNSIPPTVVVETSADSNEDIPLAQRINSSMLLSPLALNLSSENANSTNQLQQSDKDVSKKNSVQLDNLSFVSDSIKDKTVDDTNDPNISLVFSFSKNVDTSFLKWPDQSDLILEKKSKTTAQRPPEASTSSNNLSEGIRLSENTFYTKTNKGIDQQKTGKPFSKIRKDKNDSVLEANKSVSLSAKSIEVTAEIHNEPNEISPNKVLKIIDRKTGSINDHWVRESEQLTGSKKGKAMCNKKMNLVTEENSSIELYKIASEKHTTKKSWKKTAKICEEIRQEIDQEGVRKLSVKNKEKNLSQENLKKIKQKINLPTENSSSGPSVKKSGSDEKIVPANHTSGSTISNEEKTNNFLLEHSRKRKRKKNEAQDKLNVSIGLDEQMRSILSSSKKSKKTNEFFRLNSQYKSRDNSCRKELNTCTDSKSNNRISIKLKCDSSADNQTHKKYKSYIIQENSVSILDRANDNFQEPKVEASKEMKKKSADGDTVIPLLTFETFDRSENEEDTIFFSYLNKNQGKDRRTSTLSTPRNSVDDHSEDETIETIEKFISTSTKESTENDSVAKVLHVCDPNLDKGVTKQTNGPCNNEKIKHSVETSSVVNSSVPTAFESYLENGHLDSSNAKSGTVQHTNLENITENCTTTKESVKTSSVVNSSVPTAFDSYLGNDDNSSNAKKGSKQHSNLENDTGNCTNTKESVKKSSVVNSSVPTAFDSYLDDARLDSSNLERGTSQQTVDISNNDKTKKSVKTNTAVSSVPTAFDSYLDDGRLGSSKLDRCTLQQTVDIGKNDKTKQPVEINNAVHSTVPTAFESYFKDHLDSSKDVISDLEIHPVSQVRDVNFNSTQFNCNIVEDAILTPLEQNNSDLEASTESYASSEWNISPDSSMPTYLSYYEYSHTIECSTIVKQVPSNDIITVATTLETHCDKTKTCDSTSSDTNIVIENKEKDQSESVKTTEEDMTKTCDSALDSEALSVFFSNFKASKEVDIEKTPSNNEVQLQSQTKSNESNKLQANYPKTHATIIHLAKSSMLEKNRNENTTPQSSYSKKNIARKHKTSGSSNYYSPTVEINQKTHSLFNLADLKSSDIVQSDNGITESDTFPMFLCDVNDKIVQNEFINSAVLLGADDKLFEESSSSEVSCNENLNLIIASLSDDTNSSDTTKKKCDKSIQRQGCETKTGECKTETKSLPNNWNKNSNNLENNFTIDGANSTNSRILFDIQLGLEVMDNSELRIVKSSVRPKSSNFMESCYNQDKKNIKNEQGIPSSLPFNGDANIKVSNANEQYQQFYSQYHHPHQQAHLVQRFQQNQQKHIYNFHQKQRLQDQEQNHYRQQRQRQYQEHEEKNIIHHHQQRNQNYYQNDQDQLPSIKQHKSHSNASPYVGNNYEQTNAQWNRSGTQCQLNEASCKQQLEIRKNTHNPSSTEFHQYNTVNQGKHVDQKPPVDINKSNQSSTGERISCSHTQQPYMNFVHQKSHPQIYNTALNPSVSPTKSPVTYNPTRFSVSNSNTHPFVTPPSRSFSCSKNQRVVREKSLLKTVHRKKLLEKQIVKSQPQEIMHATNQPGLAMSSHAKTESQYTSSELRDNIVINPHTLRTQSIIMKSNNQSLSIIQTGNMTQQSQHQSKMADSEARILHQNKVVSSESCQNNRIEGNTPDIAAQSSTNVSSDQTIGPFITEHTFTTDYNGMYGSNDVAPYVASVDSEGSLIESDLIQNYQNMNNVGPLYYYEPMTYENRSSVLDIPILPANRMMSIAEVLANPDCNPELQNKLKTISSSKVNM